MNPVIFVVIAIVAIVLVVGLIIIRKETFINGYNTTVVVTWPAGTGQDTMQTFAGNMAHSKVAVSQSVGTSKQGQIVLWPFGIGLGTHVSVSCERVHDDNFGSYLGLLGELITRAAHQPLVIVSSGAGCDNRHQLQAKASEYLYTFNQIYGLAIVFMNNDTCKISIDLYVKGAVYGSIPVPTTLGPNRAAEWITSHIPQLL